MYPNMKKPSRAALGWITIAFIFLVHFLALRLLFDARSVPLPAPTRMFGVFISFVIDLIAGIAVYSIVHAVRRDFRSYGRAITRPLWIGESLLIVFGAALVSFGYTTLKIAVPLLRGARFDESLWEIDRWLLLGLSPSILAIEILPTSWFFASIDFIYAKIFIWTVVASFVWALGSPRRLFRISWLLGSVVLWLSGAWLYLSVPSIGPAYAYYDVFLPVLESMPRTAFSQKALIANYMKIVGGQVGTPGAGINLFFGVAAFPSLHVGFHSFVAFFVQRLYPRLRLLAWVVVGLIFIGSVVTGWHYLVDSLAGILLGWVAYRIATGIAPPEREDIAVDRGMIPDAPAGASDKETRNGQVREHDRRE